MDKEETLPKLFNHYDVYLQLLNKRLKKFEYLEKNNIIGHIFTSDDSYEDDYSRIEYLEKDNIIKQILSSSDNSYLDEDDYSEIEHSDKYHIDDSLNKQDTIILKQLLEENFEHVEKFHPSLEKHILSDKILETPEEIKIRYLGYKQYYQIFEYDGNIVDGCIYLFNQCSETRIILHKTILLVFEVLDDFDKKYIFYSNYSKTFYKTNEFIKLDYITIDNFELQIEIYSGYDYRNEFYYGYRFFDNLNKLINDNNYFHISFGICINKNTSNLYRQNINIKGIQKKN